MPQLNFPIDDALRSNIADFQAALMKYGVVRKRTVDATMRVLLPVLLQYALSHLTPEEYLRGVKFREPEEEKPRPPVQLLESWDGRIPTHKRRGRPSTR